MSIFRLFRSLFHSEASTQGLTDGLQEMLAVGKRMFDLVTLPLFGEDGGPPARDEVLRLEGELDALEKMLRRRLVSAVAVHPEDDVTARLHVLTLARDAERCGDFVKNLFQVLDLAGPITEDERLPFLREQRAFVSALFERVWRVFEEGDVEDARALLREAKTLSRRDAAIARELLAGAEADNPVQLALATRYMKRIQHHLVNFAKVVLGESEAVVPEAPNTNAKGDK